MSETCIFCAMAAGQVPASIVAEDALTMTFVDVRQFHRGHVLVIPRHHANDIRDMDETTLHAVMSAVARVSRAMGQAFPNDGVSIWHAAGAGAHQEVPHAHFHVHPRELGDGMLAVYPWLPRTSERSDLDAIAEQLRRCL